jgi:hypothetical protein
MLICRAKGTAASAYAVNREWDIAANKGYGQEAIARNH